jgi:hypothetical protein
MIFITLKYQLVSAGFEKANLWSNGKHDNHCITDFDFFRVKYKYLYFNEVFSLETCYLKRCSSWIGFKAECNVRCQFQMSRAAMDIVWFDSSGRQTYWNYV